MIKLKCKIDEIKQIAVDHFVAFGCGDLQAEMFICFLKPVFTSLCFVFANPLVYP